MNVSDLCFCSCLSRWQHLDLCEVVLLGQLDRAEGMRVHKYSLLTSVVVMQERIMFSCGHVHVAQQGQDPRGSGAVLVWVFGLYHHKHGDARRVSQAPLSQSPQTCAVTPVVSMLLSVCLLHCAVVKCVDTVAV